MLLTCPHLQSPQREYSGLNVKAGGLLRPWLVFQVRGCQVGQPRLIESGGSNAMRPPVTRSIDQRWIIALEQRRAVNPQTQSLLHKRRRKQIGPALAG
jgi:Uma2 family endonuclease